MSSDGEDFETKSKIPAYMRLMNDPVNPFGTAHQTRSRRALVLVLATATAALIGFGGSSARSEQSPSPGPPSNSPSQTRSVKDLKNLPDAHNSFGLKAIKLLYREEQNENVFISPLSIAFALSMALNGAHGETKSVMQKTLQFQNLDLSVVNQGSLSLIRRLKNPDPNVELFVANSVWTRKGMPVEEEFLSVVKDYYNAEASVLDFSSRSAADTINLWVNKSTRGKIPSIVQQISPRMVMYLINAVYFKGNWAIKFDNRLTQDRPFTPAEGAPKNHPLMRREGALPYFQTEDFQTVRLSYGKNKCVAMYVFLPKNLESFVEDLDANKWHDWMRRYRETQGTILLPRFKMQYEKELRGVLAQLGRGIAFTAQADFTGIGNGSFISEVRHKAYIHVDEEGTEATAATGVGMITSVPKNTFYMEVNRPFFFAIGDSATNEILLMGIVQNP